VLNKVHKKLKKSSLLIFNLLLLQHEASVEVASKLCMDKLALPSYLHAHFTSMGSVFSDGAADEAVLNKKNLLRFYPLKPICDQDTRR
jgi:hypothetical protein